MLLRSNFYSIFLFTLLFISIFGDLPLKNIINKTAAGSVIYFIALPLFFLFILFPKYFKIQLKWGSKYFLYYYLLTVCSSVLILFIYTLLTGNTTAYNHILVVKLFESSGYILNTFAFYYLISHFMSKISNKTIKTILFSIFIIVVIIGAVEYFSPEYLNIIHSEPIEHSRLRLTTPEPSQATLLVTVFTFSTLLLSQNIYIKGIVIVLFFILQVLIASKGGLIFILVGIIGAYLAMFLKNKNHLFSFLKITLFFFAIAGVSFWLFINIVIPSILVDIENFSSFSTRITTLFSISLVLLYYPLGLGYGTFWALYPNILLKSYEIVSALSPFPLSFAEIDFMVSTGVNLGVKSFLLQQISYNGLLAIFLLLFFVYTYKKLKIVLERKTPLNSFILKSLYFAIILMIAFGANLETAWYYLIPFALVNAISEQNRYERLQE